MARRLRILWTFLLTLGSVAAWTELELLGDGHTLRSFVRRAAVTDTVRRKNGIPKRALSFAKKLFVLLA